MATVSTLPLIDKVLSPFDLIVVLRLRIRGTVPAPPTCFHSLVLSFAQEDFTSLSCYKPTIPVLGTERHV
jgi:hypothetical protein